MTLVLRCLLAAALLAGAQAGDTAAEPGPAGQAAGGDPALETVDLGPGTSRWTIGTHETGDGKKAAAAMVQGEGVSLTAYCSRSRTVPILLAGEPEGVYPAFAARARQGLAAAGAASKTKGIVEIGMRFAGGQAYAVRARLDDGTDRIMLGDTPDGFAPYSPVLETLMAGEEVTVAAPPFSATFQLNGSHAAICGMLRRCGLASAQPRCS